MKTFKFAAHSLFTNMRVINFIIKVLCPFKFYLLGPVSVMFAYAFFGAIRPYLLKIIINTTALNTSISIVSTLWFAAFCLIAICFLMPVIQRFDDWCRLKYEPCLRSNITKSAFEYLSNHDYNFFQNQFAGNLASKINDLTLIPSIITTIINSYLTNIISISIAVIILWKVSSWFAFTIMVWTCFLIIISLITIKKFNFLANNTAKSSSIIIASIIDSLSNISNISLFSTRKYELARLDKTQRKYLVASKKRRSFMLKFYFVQRLSFAVYQTITLTILITLYGKMKITPGDFAMILGINIWISDSLSNMADQIRSFSENWGTVDEALKTIYVPSQIKDKHGAEILKVTKGKIIFDKVNFHYKDSETLFEDKCVVIEAGQKVGLIGYSGSGKSTFANLILRKFDVTSGLISIDGQDIQDVTQDSLRKLIGVIPQEPSLFHRSLLENIKFGKLCASTQEVIEAAKKAHAHEFILKLSSGYDTIVGERGVKLSGGERQRIAIARAILKDAPILILDEATSQLDSLTENNIQESLWQLMRNKTTLVIAHRLSTLLRMDRILVFKQGRIIEDGTHHELLEKNGLYKQLWDHQ